MRLRLVILLAATASLVACAKATSPEPKTDDEKALYSLGVLVSQNIKDFNFTDAELEMVKSGLVAGVRGTEALETSEMEEFIPKLQELQKTRMAETAENEKKVGAEFIAKAAKEAGAVATPSGLVYKAVEEGSGASPKSSDVVRVIYEGRFVDGKVFDATSKHPGEEPSEFPLDAVIPCWTEGLQLMKVGGKGQLVCPSDLAYGEQGGPGMRGGATLVFDVELLEIVDPAAAPAAP